MKRKSRLGIVKTRTIVMKSKNWYPESAKLLLGKNNGVCCLLCLFSGQFIQIAKKMYFYSFLTFRGVSFWDLTILVRKYEVAVSIKN